jgi:transcriptional regulator with XRE-family HTH domain
MAGTKRITPRRRRRIYLAERRDAKGLTQAQLGERLGVTDMTVSRWEREASKLSTDVMAAIAEALDCEPEDLYRPPDYESLDAILRGAPADIREKALEMARILVRKGR